jgi:16S rRNA processing protein RimM
MDRVALSPFGSISKSHGLKGAVLLKRGSLKIMIENMPKVLWLGENAQVARPWAVESLRMTSTNAYLKLREINSREEADYLSGLQVFIPNTIDSENDWNTVIGYKARLEKTSLDIGVIQEIDKTDPQALFIIQSEKGTFLVPAVGELINKINHEHQIVYFRDIEGLFTL